MRKQVEGLDARLEAARAVLDVLKTEGFIRGYATVEHKDGRRNSRSN